MSATIVAPRPLYAAVSEHRVDMALLLLRYGANPNTKTGVYIDGPGDLTPLHKAGASPRHPDPRARELMQALLDHGADPLAKDSDGRTPADWLALHRERTFDLVITPEGPRLVDHEPEKDPFDLE
jgi:ankyrin repeat protein